MSIGWGVFDLWGSKYRGFPLTRRVALTAVLHYRAFCTTVQTVIRRLGYNADFRNIEPSEYRPITGQNIWSLPIIVVALNKLCLEKSLLNYTSWSSHRRGYWLSGLDHAGHPVVSNSESRFKRLTLESAAGFLSSNLTLKSVYSMLERDLSVC